MRSTIIYLQFQLKTAMHRSKYGNKLTGLYIKARHIQRVYRGYQHRCVAIQRVGCIIKVQSLMRGWYWRRYLRNLTSWTLLVQSQARRRKAQFAYKLVLDLVSKAQGCVVGWLTRRALKKLRRERIVAYRKQIFELWRRACTPLSYRTRFWKTVVGSGFMQLNIHQDELVKLWLLLGLKDIDQKVPILSKHLKQQNEKNIHLNIEKKFGWKFAAVHERFLVVKNKLDSVYNKTHDDVIPIFPSETAFTKSSHSIEPGSKQEAILIAFKQLCREKAELYEKLKFHTNPSTLDAAFTMFNIPLGNKKKKQMLVGGLWENMEYAGHSAKIILLNERYIGDKKFKRVRKMFGVDKSYIAQSVGIYSTQWVEPELFRRSRGNTVATLKACMLAIQCSMEREQKLRLMATRKQRDAIAAGIPGRNWFDKRAIIIGKFMSCGGRHTVYYNRALARTKKTGKNDNIAEKNHFVGTQSNGYNKTKKKIGMWSKGKNAENSDKIIGANRSVPNETDVAC
mmetsp:Transcript_34919/g.51276  ORF Transcript_34919/g.51276 Transcript_34919/m.51276 type:complete len:509 (-) Transcript_34919:294-1820(-)